MPMGVLIDTRCPYSTRLTTGWAYRGEPSPFFAKIGGGGKEVARWRWA